MVNYIVEKEKGGRFYVCKADDTKPINGTYKKDKKDALKIAAEFEGVTYKEYLKLRKGGE